MTPSRLSLPKLLRVARIAVLAAAAGCASVPTPIQLAGHPEALADLVGNWSGEYEGNESKRTGVISFALRAGDTTAFGDVLMIPRGYDQHIVWTERDHPMTTTHRHPQVLTIMFVGVTHQRVTGMLDPYTDPECACLVLTTFIGRMTGPTALEGTFVTRVPGTPSIQTGTWSAKKQPARRR